MEELLSVTRFFRCRLTISEPRDQVTYERETDNVICSLGNYNYSYIYEKKTPRNLEKQSCPVYFYVITHNPILIYIYLHFLMAIPIEKVTASVIVNNLYNIMYVY